MARPDTPPAVDRTKPVDLMTPFGYTQRTRSPRTRRVDLAESGKRPGDTPRAVFSFLTILLVAIWILALIGCGTWEIKGPPSPWHPAPGTTGPFDAEGNYLEELATTASLVSVPSTRRLQGAADPTLADCGSCDRP